MGPQKSMYSANFCKFDEMPQNLQNVGNSAQLRKISQIPQNFTKFVNFRNFRKISQKRSSALQYKIISQPAQKNSRRFSPHFWNQNRGKAIETPKHSLLGKKRLRKKVGRLLQ